jgi:hypothetical protein
MVEIWDLNKARNAHVKQRIEKCRNSIGKVVWMSHRKNTGNIRRDLVLNDDHEW